MPDNSQSELPLSSFLTYRLSTLSQLLNRASARWQQRTSGLNLAEWRILATLGHFGELSPTEVSDRTMMDKAVVSRVKNALLKQGLISEVSDKTDSRKRILIPTDDGWAIYRDAMPKSQQRQARIMQQLTAEELATLNTCIEKLELHLEREASE